MLIIASILIVKGHCYCIDFLLLFVTSRGILMELLEADQEFSLIRLYVEKNVTDLNDFQYDSVTV